jgi:hypothetical protein
MRSTPRTAGTRVGRDRIAASDEVDSPAREGLVVTTLGAFALAAAAQDCRY